MEITRISEQHQPSPCSEYKESIMDYIQEGKTESLKALVKEQLPHPLDFEINLPDPFVPSESTALFMPFFHVSLDVGPDTTATAIIHNVTQGYQVLECKEVDGRLTLLCMSHEGPYAETVSDIIGNIRELLSPYVMQFFNKNSLKPLSLAFILTDLEH
ncbi:hypothetical protein [Paenibacillus sp. Marseille-Q4541]|uniref:hypothetical protein n=1 Tax=Paenibacillus sp. Marseille-Q4541 TaxID=2831522 RepID=UPI001BAD62D5|nr:hypothetical protein [Paenibacillus sp. Marseille-Q4541]